jgi:hypothetical protein
MLSKLLKISVLFNCIFLLKPLHSQVFWTESFDGNTCAACSGCSPGLVSWTVTSTGSNGGAANQWYVSDTESGLAPPACGAANQNDQSLHIGNVSTSSAAFLFCPGGDCGAAYDDSSPNEATDVRAESPTINCTGKTNITADFNYLEDGNGSLDNATFWYFNGSSWTQIDPIAKSATGCSPQGQWTAIASIALPPSADNNPNVKIGFRWINDGDGVATDPSFAVDDISLCSNCSVLPITLIDFTGEIFNSNNLITWKTASEQNNASFSIERSTTGQYWEEIGKLAGAGTSSSSHSYQFVDKRPPVEISYYRLIQTDFNGKQTASSVIQIERTPSDVLPIVFPQPSNGLFTVQSSIPFNSISLWNLLGEQQMFSYNIVKKNTVQVDAHTLPKGIYLLHLKAENKIFVQKILIQ